MGNFKISLCSTTIRLEPKIKQSEVNFFSHAQNLLSALCQNHCSKPNYPLFKYWPNCVLSAFYKASWWKFLRPIFPIVAYCCVSEKCKLASIQVCLEEVPGLKAWHAEMVKVFWSSGSKGNMGNKMVQSRGILSCWKHADGIEYQF